jgi:virulence-associated protein VagC
MNPERHVKIFKNGRNQAVRIPREVEFRGEDVIMRKEGDRLINRTHSSPNPYWLCWRRSRRCMWIFRPSRTCLLIRSISDALPALPSRYRLHSSLWQADSNKIRRMAPRELIGRCMPEWCGYADHTWIRFLKWRRCAAGR